MTFSNPENVQELSFDVLPVSYAQRQLWFLQELNPESRAYNVAAALRLQGELNTGALQEAILTVVRRHEVLRTRFSLENGEPVQLIADPPKNSQDLVPLVDLSGFTGAEKIARLRVLQDAIAKHKFDLAAGDVCEARLVRLEIRDHIFFLALHHIVSDGWSVAVLVNELAQAYTCLVSGRLPQLPDLPIQYGDYAAWQRQQLEDGKLEMQLRYWMDQLKDAATLLDLPADRPRAPVQSFCGGQIRFSVPPDSGHKLLKLGAEEHATPFMILIGAFAMLLYRYTGQRDLLIGTPIANRRRKETQGLIGCFVNALVIRARCPGNLSFRDLLRQIRQTSLSAFEHHEFPFELLVRQLGITPEPSHNPAFQVMFLFQNNEQPVIAIPGLKISDYEMTPSSSRFDLSLVMQGEGPSFEAIVEYSSDLFEVETIVRFKNHFLHLLESIGASPDGLIDYLPYLEGQEVEQLRRWNLTERKYEKALLVHDMVALHARSNPEAEAVTCGDSLITFGDLNRRANRLAQRLLRLGVRPDDLVGICSERCCAWVVGLLAILKAGAGYVPLDPRYPPDRLQFMIEDSSPRAILAQKEFVGLFDARDTQVILLDDEQEFFLPGEFEEDPVGQANSQTACYVVYTSGSTGKPKGVVLCHGGLLNLIQWHQHTHAITPGDRMSQIARMGFDASAWELWSHLTAGASIHIMDEETRLSAQLIQEFFLEKQITIAFLPPVLAEAVLNLWWPAETRLRILLSGSDRLVSHPPEGLPFKYWNHYGPTETTVIVTAGEVAPCEGASLPPTIGRPLDNSEIYLLDENLLPVPLLRTAEIYVAGDALARGYLNRPDLTADKFIPNPCSREAGARMYKTGDLGRFRADGEIEFLGRNDEQVKLRGFRIELGEIESILHQVPTVKKASVALKANVKGEKRLVAYVVAHNEEFSVPGVKALLAARLPDFMVPSAFVLMDDLPLSPNGKVDRRLLPDPEPLVAELQSDTIVWTRESEKAVAEIWREVLQAPEIGPQENFFELGGHSLAIVRVQELLKDRMKLQVPIVELFRRPTVTELAAYVEQQLSTTSEPKEEKNRNAMHGKSRAEQRIRMRSGRNAREAASMDRREQH